MDNNIENIKSDRIIGIELLRLLSMFMIVMLHYLSNGGALEKMPLFTMNYYIAWLLEAFCYGAVNCYILISGYFLVKSKQRFEKIINLWLEVIFYSVGIYIILSIFNIINFNVFDLIKSCFPILLSKYWFATCYIALYALFPYLNILINAMTQKQMKQLLYILILIFSVWKTIIPFASTLNPGGGSNIVWFVVLYFCGAYIRLYWKDEHNKYSLLWYVIISCAVAFSKFIFQYIFKLLGVERFGGALFYHYDSLLIFLASIMLFLFFKNVDIKDRHIIRIVNVVGPLTFGVYLIHNNEYLNKVLWFDLLHVDYFYGSNYFIVATLLYVSLIYFICCILDYLRLKIFNKYQFGNIIIRLYEKHK